MRDERISKDIEQKNSEYKKIDDIVGENFLQIMLQKSKKISSYIKDINTDDDQEYLKSQNKEYAKLINKGIQKIQKIIHKAMIYSGHEELNEINE
jgi:hypothetical protein